MTKPVNRDREVVIAANASVATLRDDRDVHAKARAAQLLVKLAYQKPPNRLIIVKAGALGELVKLLKHEKEDLRTVCCQACMILCYENEAAKTSVMNADAREPLCALLKHGSTCTVKAMAARCICTLAEHHEVNRKLFVRDCCGDLKDLLKTGDDRAKYAAAACLRRLDKHLAAGQLGEVGGTQKKAAPSRTLGSQTAQPAVTRRGDLRAPVRRR